MENKLALVTGSFDPITLGHVDIVRRAATLFDRVILLVANNEEKQYMFSAEERAEIARAALEDIPGASVDVCDGYVSAYAKEHGASAFVRGIRDEKDVAYEQDMAERNLGYCGVETVLLFTKPEYHAISSTAARMALAEKQGEKMLIPQKSLEKISEILCRRGTTNL